MYTGSCLCGIVQYEIQGAIEDIVHCHCSRCRRAQGSSFATNGNVARHEFKFVSGEDQLTAYPSSATQKKYFCRHCGSPIISKNTNIPDKIRIRLGSIESTITERPEAHMFVASKADWDVICDDLVQID